VELEQAGKEKEKRFMEWETEQIEKKEK